MHVWGVALRWLFACSRSWCLPAHFAAFPGPDTDPDPRNDTPNDPGFDPCELDDAETPGEPPECTTYFSEQYGSFGFSPDSANTVPLAPLETHPLTATQYLDCAQLDAQGKAANVADGVPQCSQISGVRADAAWKYSTGDPDTVVAILDTGIRWQDRELLEKVHLNEEELPQPVADRASPLDGGPACNTFTAADDANGDGAFNVRDFACDTRVGAADGDTESDDLLDGSDLIASFSDENDDDSNGYEDDIAGWDFFDDDNDPFDASSCCSANGHGTGRAREAVADTNNGQGETGMCPDCQFMPLRIWDTFVVPTDFHSMGVVYAADNGADVVEGANGGLTNTRFSRRAYQYADQKGLALMLVSSDINSANHNYPTNYNEAIYVAGALPDTAPFESCDGIGLPLVGDVVPIPDEASGACSDFFGELSSSLGITASAQPPTTSFFRNANLTQYGGKADIVLMGATGSENTGQASGAAALVASYGREVFGENDPLSGNEIRQLLTMTAEDVRPLNTGAIGLPDKAQIGWDPHFGYGRVNLAGAMATGQGRAHPARGTAELPGLVHAGERRSPRRRPADPGPHRCAALGHGRRKLADRLRVRRGRPGLRVPADTGRDRLRARRRPARDDAQGDAELARRLVRRLGGRRLRSPRGRHVRRQPGRRRLSGARPRAPLLPDPPHGERAGQSEQHRPLPQGALRLSRRWQPRWVAATDRVRLERGSVHHRLRRGGAAAAVRPRRRQRAGRDPGDVVRRALRPRLRRRADPELQRRRSPSRRSRSRSRLRMASAASTAACRSRTRARRRSATWTATWRPTSS